MSCIEEPVSLFLKSSHKIVVGLMKTKSVQSSPCLEHLGLTQPKAFGLLKRKHLQQCQNQTCHNNSPIAS